MNAAAPLPSVFDTQALSRLKTDLRQDDPQALQAAARQFEAVFLQMVMKSMRAAAPQTGPFDSDQTRFYQELLDAQLAQALAAKGGVGLAAVIERQLSRAATPPPDGDAEFLLAPPGRFLPFSSQRPLPLPERQPLTWNALRADRDPSRSIDRGWPEVGDAALAPALPLDGSPWRTALGAGAPNPAPANAVAPAAQASQASQAFVSAVWPHATAASQATGIPAHFLVGHAALESGWGRAEPRFADGRPSHNLFGIKAGGNWQGATVEATTTEYVGGVAEKRVERFRAYGSYAEAFRDYAQLLTQSPRYAAVLGSRAAADFAQGLQRAGYATDPDYAQKLQRVIARLG